MARRETGAGPEEAAEAGETADRDPDLAAGKKFYFIEEAFSLRHSEQVVAVVR